jgi:hypothetical protein
MSLSAKETVDTGKLAYGHSIAGQVVQRLCDYSSTAYKGILIRCPGSADPVPNSAPVWVGSSPEVAPDSGFPIPPGSHLIVPVDDASTLYIISTADGMDVAWMAV